MLGRESDSIGVIVSSWFKMYVPDCLYYLLDYMGRKGSWLSRWTSRICGNLNSSKFNLKIDTHRNHPEMSSRARTFKCSCLYESHVAKKEVERAIAKTPSENIEIWRLCL